MHWLKSREVRSFPNISNIHIALRIRNASLKSLEVMQLELGGGAVRVAFPLFAWLQERVQFSWQMLPACRMILWSQVTANLLGVMSLTSA